MITLLLNVYLKTVFFKKLSIHADDSVEHCLIGSVAGRSVDVVDDDANEPIVW